MLVYIGLVNNFHDHVRNMNDRLRPLRKNGGTIRLEWSPELIRIYEESRRIIAYCQQLIFIDEIKPITLHTDASNYGIGGYLYQTVDTTV